MIKKIWIFSLALSLTVMIASGCTATTVSETPSIEDTTKATEKPVTPTAEEEENTPEEREPYYMDDLALTMLDGTETSLYAYEGKIIILNFWATWCKYCVEEMPLLDEVNKRDDLVVLAVSTGEDKETVQAYIDEYGYEFDVFVDESASLSSSFGVTGLPTSFFIAPDMELLHVQPGMVDDPTLTMILDAIDNLLENE
jgi:thiol-disulfide isomerase/thioredoxin